MNLTEYQKLARTTAIYTENPKNKILYPVLGIISESGEVCGKIKKLIRDDEGEMTKERKSAIVKELGDCCWYLSSICSDCGIDFSLIKEMISPSIRSLVKTFDIFRLSAYMSNNISEVANILLKLYYDHGAEPVRLYKFREFNRYLSIVMTCLDEMASKCDTTIEDICELNMNKLLDRKQRGVLRGDGDNR